MNKLFTPSEISSIKPIFPPNFVKLRELMKYCQSPKNISKLLILLSLSTSAVASQDDFFSIFEEKLEPTIALDVKSLDYNRPEGGQGKAGKLVFSKLKIVTTMANINLQNGNQIFDADVYVKQNFIGLNGPYTKFAYQIDDINYTYLDSFRWMKLNDLSFLMNHKTIDLYGKKIEFQEPQTFVSARSFKLHCDRHADYLVNDGEGFTAGCWNYGIVTPQEGMAAFDFRYGFTALEEETPEGEDPFTADVQASFEKMQIKEEVMSAKSMVTKMIFDKKTNLKLSDMEISCKKHAGLIEFNEDNILVPCLNDLKLNSKAMNLDFEDMEDELYLDKLIGSMSENLIKIATPKLNYKANGLNLDLHNGTMNCAKREDFSPLAGADYLLACFNNGSISRLNGENPVKFSMELDDLEVEEEADEMKYLDLYSDLDYFAMGDEKIILKGSNAGLVLDKNMFITLNTAEIECGKEKDLVDHDVDKILTTCKEHLEAETKSILIDDREDPNKTSFIRIFPKFISARPDVLGITATSMELLDNEEVTLIDTLFLDCGRLKGNDLFNKDDVIKGCLNKGEVTIKKIFTEEAGSNDEIVVKNEDLNFNYIKKRTKPGVEDLFIRFTNNQMLLKLKARVLGMKLKTEIRGSITFEPEMSRFILDVTKSKLPLGIKSKKILLWIVKKFVVNETIQVSGDKIIVNF